MKFRIALSLISLAMNAQALDSNGVGPTRDAAVALYVFKPENVDQATWTIRDLAPNPLDLRAFVNRTGALRMGTDYLELVEPNMIRSIASADKIVNACKASNELTVEMWVESRTPSEKLVNHEDDQLPNNIFKQSLRLISLSDTYFKEFRNFGLYQAYDMGDTYKASSRTSGNSNNTDRLNGDLVDPMIIPKENFLLGKKQHIVFVRNAGGTGHFYYSDDNGLDVGPVSTARGFGGNFANWHSSGTAVNFDTPDDATGSVSRALDIRLTIGNESSANNDFSKPTTGGEGLQKRSRHWPWMGKVYMVAVYCKALSRNEILGSRAPRTEPPKVYPIDVSRRITPSMTMAQNIYTRLTGVKTPIDNPVIAQMADLIDSNQPLDAAALATSDPNFLNITVRDMAAKMSTRDEVQSAPLSDFVATIIGFTRDKLDARGLLTSDKVYVADTALAAVPSSLVRDILTSNNHYLNLQSGFDLAKVLKIDNQMILNTTRNAAEAPTETAGLLTTRAWMEAHGIAGTNRRLVEFAFREFLCTPIEKWADPADSDAFIGRDVDRFPAGSHTKFTTTCRSCHSRMDPMRGAFAYFTFSNGLVKHSLHSALISANDREDANGNLMKMSTGLKNNDPSASLIPASANISLVATKMNHNFDVFPGGRVIYDNSFHNSATDKWGMSYFEWNPATLSGYGVKDFGRMISESGQFPRCMAKRVFASVCKREPQSFDETMIRTVAKEFVEQGYKMDYLFKKIVITPNCLGELK